MKESSKLFFVLFLVFTFTAAAQTVEKFRSDIHGYISQGFLYSNYNNYLADTKNGTFQFNELGINFSTQVIDRLRVGVQFAALDLGNLGNDKVFIDWAYADYRWQDWFGIRLGKIKIPMGFYNKTRDVDMLRTFVLLPQCIYSDTFRDTLIGMKGMGIYGDITLHTWGDISYEFLGGTMNIDKDSSTTKGVEAQGLFKVEEYNIKKAYCGQITWETPLKGLRLAFSRINIDLYLYGFIARDMDEPVPLRQGTPIISKTPDWSKSIYSLEYTWKNLILAVEYFWQDQTNITTIDFPGLPPLKIKNKLDGFYISATYRFSDRFEAGIYYSAFYKNRKDRNRTRTNFYKPPFTSFQKDACFTLRFDPNDHWTFKLEGHRMDGTALCFFQDNPDKNGDNLPDYTRKWYLLAAKMTFSF